MQTQLAVTTHVGRDLLQSSALFKHEHSVVWEYVSNGLEYVDPGTNPTVIVKIDAKRDRIEIGVGDWDRARDQNMLVWGCGLGRRLAAQEPSRKPRRPSVMLRSTISGAA